LKHSPGNSGGPAFNRSGECVGIAFQSLKSDDVENIGYVIPTPVIYHFLTDFERNSQYTGFPALGIQWQRMESPALRQSLGLKKGQKGVLIRRLEPTSFAYSVLKEVSDEIPQGLLSFFVCEMVCARETAVFCAHHYYQQKVFVCGWFVLVGVAQITVWCSRCSLLRLSATMSLCAFQASSTRDFTSSEVFQ
jgi:hypothetical protein